MKAVADNIEACDYLRCADVSGNWRAGRLLLADSIAKMILAIRASNIDSRFKRWVGMLIQMFVRPNSVISRICFPTAPKRLLQQYRHIPDLPSCLLVAIEWKADFEQVAFKKSDL